MRLPMFVFFALFAAGATAATPRDVTGTFQGIEVGDYSHLLLRTDDGRDESFFVLQTDPGLDEFIAQADALIGTPVRVRVEDRTEDIPEAGGPTEITVVLAIERLAPPSHCSADEQIVFACRSGRKLISVCASKTLTATEGHVRYRFGPPGNPEIEWPDASDSTRNQIAASTWAFSGGGGAYLRFVRRDHDYLVYTAIGKGWGEKAGVAVERAGRIIANPQCDGVPTSLLGPDFFQQAGIVEDDQGFELPD